MFLIYKFVHCAGFHICMSCNSMLRSPSIMSTEEEEDDEEMNEDRARVEADIDKVGI